MKETSSAASDQKEPNRPPSAVRRAALESIVIVVSILLAFGIDAWWEERKEAADMRESLEVVRRDLVDALSQLQSFEEFSANIARTSLAAARALSEPNPVAVENRSMVEDHLVRSMSRRTVRLPRAGYTDLLNTGNLTEIDNRELRDLLVQFYEAADRSQKILEKNSGLFTDQGLKDALISTGLLVPIPTGEGATNVQKERNLLMREVMGPDFPVRPTRLWQLPIDAPELDRVVVALIQNARGAATAQVIARDTHDQATEVIARIDEHLVSL
jgi:hypothetical protein